MAEPDAAALRTKAAHFRQLALEIGDRQTADALNKRADELEANATAIESERRGASG